MSLEGVSIQNFCIFKMTSITGLSDSDQSPQISPIAIRWKERRGRSMSRRKHKHRQNSGRRNISEKNLRYVLGQSIEGPHASKVCIGVDSYEDDRQIVVKSPQFAMNAHVEMEALARLQGTDSIVSLLDFFHDNDTMHLVFDYVPGVDLIDWMQYFYQEKDRTETEIETAMRPVILQIIKALAFCHERGVAHRDIKPDNIRINPETKHVTLIDFGLSYIKDMDMDTQERVGSKDYLPPELRARGAPVPIDPFKSDIWALGVLIHALVHQQLPFSNGDLKTRTEPNALFSGPLRELISSLLTEDPKERPDIPRVFGFSFVKEK
jgi:serine/threonine protein kinase